MSILPITVYGDAILRKKTNRITKIDDELIQNIKDMFQTMRYASGIGLAANQVGFGRNNPAAYLDCPVYLYPPPYDSPKRSPECQSGVA